MKLTISLIVVILLMFAVAHAQTLSSAQKNSNPPPANSNSSNGSDNGDSGNDNDNNAEMSQSADAILTDMNSTVTDVRGANGVQHGTDGATKTNCMRAFAQSNIINSHNNDMLRESGMYGEEILGQGRDQAETRGTKCRHPRANNTVKCVRELVDEGSKKLSPQEQLEEDRHLLLDYILPC